MATEERYDIVAKERHKLDMLRIENLLALADMEKERDAANKQLAKAHNNVKRKQAFIVKQREAIQELRRVNAKLEEHGTAMFTSASDRFVVISEQMDEIVAMKKKAKQVCSSECGMIVRNKELIADIQREEIKNADLTKLLDESYINTGKEIADRLFFGGPNARIKLLERYMKAWEAVMSVMPTAKRMYELLLNKEDGE